VLGPGLGDGLQLDVGGVAPQGVEVVADRPEFLGGEEQVGLAAEGGQGGVVQPPEGDGALGELGGRAVRQRVGVQRLARDLVNDAVGQELLGDGARVGRGHARDVVPHARGDGGVQAQQVADGGGDGLPHGVHYAREGVDLDDRRVARGRRAHSEGLADRVREQRRGDLPLLVG
jgi:hypothetical protein